jgi:Type III restriction enzyme, res subunit
MFDFKKAYLDAKRDLGALESVLFQFGILPNESIEIKICGKNPNRYIFTDFGTPKPIYSNIFQKGKGYDIEGVIKGLYPKNAAQQIQILTNLGFGNYPQTNNGATQNPNKGATVNPQIVQKKVQKKGVQQSKIYKTIFTPASWKDAEGLNLLAYFQLFTGCGDADFLTKYGVSPLKSVQHGNFLNCINLHSFTVGKLQKLKGISQKNAYAYAGEGIAGCWGYGFEQLPIQPKSTDILIFVEGEKDAICANYHLNPYGFFAVTVGSAAGGLSEGEANNLKSLFSNIFVLWDNDKAGIEGSQKFADAHGFGWIDAKDFFGEKIKDICELWGVLFGYAKEQNLTNPKGTAQKWLLDHFKESTKKSTPKLTQSTIPAIIGDRFSVSVEGAYIHKFDQYLGENTSLNTVLDLVKQNPRLMIQSPAGTGKSTIIKKLIDALSIGVGSNYASITVIVPTTSIGLQLSEAFQKEGVKCVYFDGKNKVEDEFINTNFWITTYDSTAKFQPNHWSNTYLIIDEFHQIANDYSYRRNAMRTVWGVLKNPKQPAILLSATPNNLLCSNLTEGFNFTPLLCYPQTTNRINTRTFKYDANIKHALDFVLKNKPNTEGSILLKYDDFTTLTAWKEYLISLGYTVELFCSKEGGKFKEDNPNYQNIVDNGLLKTHADFILTTTLLEAGVSLKFPISLVCSFDNCGSWARDIQLATRARFDAKTGVNKLVEFWLFFSSKRGKTAKDNPLHKSTQTLTATQIFTKHYQIAEALANNHLQPNGVDFSLSDNLSIDTYKQKFIYQPQKSEGYAVDVPAILGNIYELETNTATITETLKRIQSFDPRFIIQPETQINIQKIPFLKDWFAVERDARKARKIAFAALFLGTNPYQIRCAFIASFVDSKDKERRKRLSDYLGERLTKELQTEGRNFKEANPYAFEARGKSDFCIKIFDLLKTTNPQTKAPYTVAEAAQKLTIAKPQQIQKETDAQRLKRLLKAYKKDKGLLSPKDFTFVEEFLRVHKTFSQIQNNQQKGKLAPQTLAYFTQKLNASFPQLNKEFTEKTAYTYLEQFYILERKQERKKGKSIYLYTVKGVNDFN